MVEMKACLSILLPQFKLELAVDAEEMTQVAAHASLPCPETTKVGHRQTHVYPHVCFSWGLPTLSDPEVEGSRSQQRSVTDHPPPSDCTKAQKTSVLGALVPLKRGGEELPNSDNFLNPRLPGVVSYLTP